MKKKAIIISIKSYKLTPNEKKLIATEKPWGLILFKRNIKSFQQSIIQIIVVNTFLLSNKALKLKDYQLNLSESN